MKWKALAACTLAGLALIAAGCGGGGKGGGGRARGPHWERRAAPEPR